MKILERRKLQKYIKIFALVLFVYVLLNPARHAKHYIYIPLSEIFSQLVQIPQNTTKLKTCPYDTLQNRDINFKDSVKYYHEIPHKGGEYIPTNCTSLFKVAIIIPYRKREEQLRVFVNYAHHFLQQQHLHYRIYVVDQQDVKPFNRAKMFNVGAHEAIKAGYPCLILHDVDLIPLNMGNIYACSVQPRHMSSSVDTFRFNLPYDGLFGGVVSIQTKQFIQVNGMSNVYEGWGGEDDDFFDRLRAHDIHPYRFPPQISRYTMLKHKKAKPSENRYNLLKKALDRQKTDGLSNLLSTCNFTTYDKQLYTHIIVN